MKKETKSRVRRTVKVILLCSFILALSLLVELLFRKLISIIAGPAASTPLWTFIYSILVYGSSLLIIFLLHKKPFKYFLDKFTFPSWTDLLLSPIAYVIYIVISYLLTLALTNMPFYTTDTGTRVFRNLITIPDKIFAFVSLVIIAPIAEELIYRGFLYKNLKRNLPKKFSIPLAIILTSLTFALAHGNLAVGIDVFAMSVVSCLLLELTGHLHSSILLHIIKNGIAFYLVYTLGIA